MPANRAGSCRRVTVGTNAALVLGASYSRMAVFFSAGPNVQVTVSTESDVPLGGGVNLGQGQVSIKFCYEEWGELIRKPWYAIAAQAGTVIGIADTELMGPEKY